jgi:hypothetical protein
VKKEILVQNSFPYSFFQFFLEEGYVKIEIPLSTKIQSERLIAEVFNDAFIDWRLESLRVSFRIKYIWPSRRGCINSENCGNIDTIMSGETTQKTTHGTEWGQRLGQQLKIEGFVAGHAILHIIDSGDKVVLANF